MDPVALLTVFDRRVVAYEQALQLCANTAAPDAMANDAVHDLRVAIRRLLAMLDLLHSAGFTTHGRKLRRLLKHQLKGLGQLRNTQVMLASLDPALASLPAQQDFLSFLRRRQQRLLGRGKTLLQLVQPACTRTRFDRLRRHLLGSDDSAWWQAGLSRALESAREAVWCCHEQVKRGSLASIHRERIAFKRFRYTTEIVAELEPGRIPSALFPLLREYQTLLGDLQDAVVLCTTVQRFARAGRRAACAPFLSWVLERRAQAVEAYWQKRNILADVLGIYMGLPAVMQSAPV